MYILDIGIIFACGLGIGQFEHVLKGHRQTPSDTAYRVNLDAVKDEGILKKLRRSDRFSKMAVLAATDAFAYSGIEDIEEKRVGIIVATAFGPHVTTFKFLDDILDYGHDGVSPTTFSNSVHNAAASYIAETLNIQGPTLTVTQFHFSFQYALQLAQVWLNEGRCDYVLVGAAEQYGDVLGYVYSQKLTIPDDRRIRPFNFRPPSPAVPGEGAVFFLLGNESSKNVYCEIENIIFEDTIFRPAALNIIDANGMLKDESIYMTSLSPEIPTAAFSPLFGSMMVGSAFNCTAGALIIKNQACYANPVSDNPYGINLAADTKSAIEYIHCIGYNCTDKKATLILKKK